MSNSIHKNTLISLLLRFLKREGLATPWGIFVINDKNYDLELIAHEEKHLEQMGNLVGSKDIIHDSFWKKVLASIRYSYHYITGIRKLMKTGLSLKEAYLAHPFEVEAREAQRKFKWGI